MLRKLSQRINNEEKGFTLIELLVVILIIGILAAIALPAFLGQQKKGQDADAKSLARNMVSQVESCFAVEEDYTKCTNPADTGLPINTGTLAKGEVQMMSGATATTYKIDAYSKSGGHFYIEKLTAGGSQRTCTPAGEGGCKAAASGTTGTW
jgi:type IV pilus assembly protein PilA